MLGKLLDILEKDPYLRELMDEGVLMLYAKSETLLGPGYETEKNY